jgi:hypothetical protein
MNNDKQIVQFDMGEISLTVKEGSRITVRREAEEFIKRWLDFERKFDEAKETLKQNLLAEMEKTNLIKVEGEDVRLLRRFFGDRYEIVDPQIAADFVITEMKSKVDVEAVDQYVKDNNDVPPGIKLKDRTMSLVISEIKKNEDNKS